MIFTISHVTEETNPKINKASHTGALIPKALLNSFVPTIAARKVNDEPELIFREALFVMVSWYCFANFQSCEGWIVTETFSVLSKTSISLLIFFGSLMVLLFLAALV